MPPTQHRPLFDRGFAVMSSKLSETNYDTILCLGVLHSRLCVVKRGFRIYYIDYQCGGSDFNVDKRSMPGRFRFGIYAA